MRRSRWVVPALVWMACRRPSLSTPPDGWVVVDRPLDDSVCRREHGQQLPDRPTHWRMRCVPVAPRQHSQPGLTTPALLCQLDGVREREASPLLVAGVAPGKWMVLG